MALLITITDAGRAEIINADNTGTGPVVITEIGFGTGQYAPSKTQTALTAEVKRVSSIAGLVVADDTIHVMAKDEGPDAYNVGEFGLFSTSGTLVAVYSQVAASGWIIQKAGASTLLLAVDIILESLDAASLTFGDISFTNPPATTETPGVVQLEDSLTSPSATKALTAKQGKALQDGKQPLHANLTAFSGLEGVADRLPYFTGAGALNLATITAKARTLLDDADATAMQATLELVKQTSLGDTTAGRVLLNGAHGLGGNGIGWPNATTANDYTIPTGFYRAPSPVGGFPYADYWGVLVEKAPDGDFVKQTIWSLNQPNDIFFRSIRGGTPDPWVKVWHTDNLVKQTSKSDTTAGSVLLNGAHGLGEQTLTTGNNLASLNNLDLATGFYAYAASATGSPSGVSPGVLIVERYSASAARQTAMLVNGAADAVSVWTRQVRSGPTYGAWVELWHSGNLVKQTSATDTGAGRVMLTGAFGLGGVLIATDMDTVAGQPNGFYSTVVGTTTFTPPAGLDANGVIWNQVRAAAGASAQASQLWVHQSTGRMFRRSAFSNAWTAWKEDWNSVNLSPTELSPPGAVVHFARNTAPSGWLKANGAAVNRTTYAALFAAIGTTFGAGDGSTTFNLPDLRGEFVRGWDDGRGIDSGRALGTFQAGTTHAHASLVGATGAIGSAWSDGLMDGSDAGGSKEEFARITAANGGATFPTGTTYQSNGADLWLYKSRPRNVALLACIKY